MNNVISLAGPRSPSAQRAQALFGPNPLITFQPDATDGDLCCSVRLVQGSGEAWYGVVGDHANFTDRIRMGMRPRFVVHHNGDVPTICGDAEVRIVSRVDEDDLDGLDARDAKCLRELLGAAPFPYQDSVVIEVCPRNVRVDEGEVPSAGVVPKT